MWTQAQNSTKSRVQAAMELEHCCSINDGCLLTQPFDLDDGQLQIFSSLSILLNTDGEVNDDY